MEYGLNQKTINAIRSVLQQYSGIQQAIIYGSRAKGNYKRGSDIDLTLIAPGLTLSTLFAIENLLDDLLLPYKIDLSLYHHIDNPDLKEHIQRVGKIFYQGE